MPKISASIAERLELNSIPEPNSGCTLWFGSIDRCGYGQLGIKGRNRRATHLALELDGRIVSRGMCACHKCDMPACINPDHLFVGTQADNIADMIAKGRQNYDGIRQPKHRISNRKGILLGPRKPRTHCKNGHEFTPENTAIRKNPVYRECRICAYDRRRAWKRRAQ